MTSMTIADFKDALTRAGKTKGAAGVTLQKKLLLDNYMIVDADGLAVDPETLDVHLIPSESAPAVDEVVEASTEAAIAKSIRSVISSEFRRIAPTANSVVLAPTTQSFKSYGKLKAFSSKEQAFRFGSWCMAAMGHQKSAQFCKTNGIHHKAHYEGNNSAGGFLVPDEFENEIVTLREQYGVFRRNAKVYPMSSDTLRISKRANGLTAYFVGEINAGTESTQTFDSVQMVAKKLMCVTTVSNELLEDATVNIGDDLANEIAYQFSNKEDDAGFNGTGTSTYGGIVGLAGALTDTTYQVSAGAGSTLAAVTKDEISAGLGLLPNWAFQRNNVKIYCHKTVWHTVFERLAMAVGGATANEVSNGIGYKYFGIPVEFSQVMPKVDGASAVYAYVGDLSQGCYFGDRRSTSVAFSDSALNTFEQDERAVRGSERFDIICANVGSSSATGAVVKLVQ